MVDDIMNEEKYFLSSYGVWLNIISKKTTDDDETLYLVDFDGDECYLIIGDSEYEYAELRKALFDEDKAKKVFEMI